MTQDMTDSKPYDKGKGLAGPAVVAVLTALAWIGTFLLNATGLGQVRSFFTSVALGPTYLLILALVCFGFSPSNRQVFSDRLVVGFLAGLCATILQVVAELLLYSAGLLQFSMIRQAMLTSLSSAAWGPMMLTFMYYFVYFISIGMTYAVVAGRSRWLYGLGWALLLEISEWQEFLTFVVSVHIVYGIALGVLVQWLAGQYNVSLVRKDIEKT